MAGRRSGTTTLRSPPSASSRIVYRYPTRPERESYRVIPKRVDFVMVTDRAYLNRMLIGDIPITGEVATAIEGGDPAPMVAIMPASTVARSKPKEARSGTCRSSSATSTPPVDPGRIDLIVR